MTPSEISSHTRRVAKPVRFPESMLLRLEAGVLARLRTAAGEKEVAEIVRAAVMADLLKRERAAAKVEKPE